MNMSGEVQSHSLPPTAAPSADVAASFLDSNLEMLSGTSSLDDLPSDPTLPSGSYGLSFAPAAVPLVADRVALPSVAGAVDLMEFLPPAVKSFYSDPKLCLRSHPNDVGSQPRLPPPRAHAASHEEYVRLLHRMKASNMISFTTTPRVVNGVFGVAKPDGSQRLIIDARAANRIFGDPPRVTLPTPDLFTQIGVPREEPTEEASVYRRAPTSRLRRQVGSLRLLLQISDPRMDA